MLVEGVGRSVVSIPRGAVKRWVGGSIVAVVFYVSIPRGAVKSLCAFLASDIRFMFQFQEVQLKEYKRFLDYVRRKCFNSKRCS